MQPSHRPALRRGRRGPPLANAHRLAASVRDLERKVVQLSGQLAQRERDAPLTTSAPRSQVQAPTLLLTPPPTEAAPTSAILTAWLRRDAAPTPTFAWREATRAELTPLRREAAPAPTPTASAGAAPVSLEERAGKRWITWVGALLVFVAVALFLKLALDSGGGHRALGPLGRTLLAAGFGVALLVAGWRAARRSLTALAQGLFGAGLAVLYAAIFAGLAHYHIYSRELAFALMVAVTAGGTLLALRHQAQALAILAVIGGLATPMMIGNGGGNRDVLFAYVAILDLGVLAIAATRRWRVLEWVAFTGTALLIGGWLDRGVDVDVSAAAPVMAWLAVVFSIFLVLPFAYHLRRRIPLDPGRFWLAIANGAVTFAFASSVLDNAPHALGVVALVMGAAYGALGRLTRRRLPEDGRALLGFVALAVGFATLAIPLELRSHGLVLAWALEAPVLLYLGYRYRYVPLRVASLAVLALAACGLLAHAGLSGWSEPEAELSAPAFWNLDFASALFAPLAAVVCVWIHRRHRGAGDRRDRVLLTVSALAAAGLTLIAIQIELLHAGGSAASATTGVALWTLAALGFLIAGVRLPILVARVAAVVTASVAAVLLLAAYGEGNGAASLVFANARFAVAVGVVAVALAIGRALRRASTPLDTMLAGAVAAVVGVGVWALLSAEVAQHLLTHAAKGTARWRGQMALSLVWGGYAIALLALGFRRRDQRLRVAGLALFGLTAGKLVLVDLAGAGQIYRVASFLAIGLLMLGASFLYHRLARRLREPGRAVPSKIDLRGGDAAR